MAAEATLLRDDCDVRKTAVAAIVAGEVQQMSDGRAGVLDCLKAAAINDSVSFTTEGQFTFAKTTGIVLLDGGRAYWDHSANKVHFRKVNDRDFYLGRVVGDAASAATTCVVNINVDPPYDVLMRRDAFLSVPTGTQAVGGFGFPKILGGAQSLELTATSEAQCIDLLSVDRFDVSSNPILEAIFRVPTNGSGAAVDFNLGFANGTHTSDADSITEHCLIHIDGASTAINAQSKDGTTTVAATDTTKTITAGSAVANRKEVWMDARDPSDVQIYIDAVLVLGSTVFDLSHATGPLGILAHLEKSTGTTVGTFVIDDMRVRLMQD